MTARSRMIGQESASGVRLASAIGTVLRHTLLSYVLGSVILATTINLVVQVAAR